MEILQIHHQNSETGDSEFCFEFEADSHNAIEFAVAMAWEKYPLKDGYIFLICGEGSKKFLNERVR